VFAIRNHELWIQKSECATTDVAIVAVDVLLIIIIIYILLDCYIILCHDDVLLLLDNKLIDKGCRPYFNFRPLNPSKTEFLIFGLPQQLSKLNNPTIHFIIIIIIIIYCLIQTTRSISTVYSTQL